MTIRKALLLVWLLALCIRFGMLFFLHDANYVAGMAHGEMAYSLVTGQGFKLRSLPGCGIVYVQNAQNRLIDVQDYLKNYELWCKELGLPPVHENESEQGQYPNQMPGNAILLAATYMLFGQYRYIFLQVILVGLDSLGIFMLFWIGKTYFSSAVGILASILYALAIPLIRITIAGGIRDSWMPILMLTLLFCFLWALNAKKNQLRWFGCVGIFTGFGVYLRPDLLLLVLCFGFLMWLSRRYSLRQVFIRTLWMVLPVLIMLFPWWLRNYFQFGRFILTAPVLAGTMWEAFGEFDTPGQSFWRFGNPFGAVYDDYATYQQYVAEGGNGGFYDPLYMDHFNSKVVNALLTQPVWYISLLVRRVVEIPIMGSDWGFDVNAIPWKIVRVILLRGTTLVLFLSAAWGVLINWRRFWDCIFILSVMIYDLAIHIPISANYRYLFPSYSGMLVLTACSLLYFWQSIQRKHPHCEVQNEIRH